MALTLILALSTLLLLDCVFSVPVDVIIKVKKRGETKVFKTFELRIDKNKTVGDLKRELLDQKDRNDNPILPNASFEEGLTITTGKVHGDSEHLKDFIHNSNANTVQVIMKS
ncbi:hypothetical protein DdX_15808 [Ditylenchus destructor]|uniref:Ubiquitin-like domain-containing protein n=1 Tax=Ditylenchus destructor TaxID=166010 RepID=A0AAD4MQ78_9BILA|nr:hypothetical protein DdX_15808 [Ditylenchus destructor]